MAYTDIDDPTAYFQTVLYTGNATARSITFDGNTDMQPDWVWGKIRSQAYSHRSFDSVRGAGKGLHNDTNEAEFTQNANVSAFNSNGFSLGDDNGMNSDGDTHVAWCWKKVAGVFDIQTYTGNGSNRTISHNLGAVPTMMVTKVRSTTNQWLVYHKSMGNTETMKWDDNSAATTQTNLWNSTTPTSSVFSVGTHTGSNLNGGTFVMYLFGDKQGVSKMGSYTGNGNADGTFVYTGFKPAFIMLKNSSSAETNWFMHDVARNPSNPIGYYLTADNNTADQTTELLDITSNGFKQRNSYPNLNDSGDTYIYMAFAENPFVTSTGVPATAR